MRFLSLAIMAFMLVFFSANSLASSQGNNNGDNKRVNITITNNKPGKPYRSQTSPIDCYYQSGVLYFSTWEDLGEAEIIVEDTETGFYSEDTLNGIDATTINIAGASGTVLIYVNTSDASYYGEFTL